MPNGFGRGFSRGFGGGMGFGFRGSSPPWPYVGIGRGGLPRCGYFLSGAATLRPWLYPQTPAYGVPSTYGYTAPAGSMTSEELDYLKDQAKLMKDQMEQIKSKIRELEAEQ